jgi:hypothetical protein
MTVVSRFQAAALLELAKNRVVVFDELQADVCTELFGVSRAEMVLPRDERHHRVDEGELREEQAFATLPCACWGHASRHAASRVTEAEKEAIAATGLFLNAHKRTT